MIGRHLERVGVARQGCCLIAEGQALAVGIETQVIDESGCRQTRRRQILTRLEVDHVELAGAALVTAVGEVVSVARNGDFLDISRHMLGNNRLVRG